MTVDTEKMKALALAANDLPVTMQPFVSIGGQVVIGTFSLAAAHLDTVAKFYDSANPAAVLELIAEVERLRAEKDSEWNLPAKATEAMRNAVYMALHYHMCVIDPNEWQATDDAITAIYKVVGAHSKARKPA